MATESKCPALSDEEIGAVQTVVMAVSAGRVNAQLRQEERSKKQAN